MKWALSIFLCLPLSAAEYYAATTGSSANPGTIASPWTLRYALTNASVSAGDTIWLRGGTYGSGGGETFTFTRTGTAGNPVTLRQYPNERAVIDGELFTRNYQVLWGFEIKNSAAVTRTNYSYVLTPGLSMNGEGDKAINLVIHDVGAPGIWLPTTNGADREVYGCIIWACGLYQIDYGTQDARGPNVYMQNESNTVSVSDNISFKSWTSGLKAYAETGQAKGFVFDGNCCFLNDNEAIYDVCQDNVIPSVTIRSNHLYNNMQTVVGQNINGFGAGHGTLEFYDNYIVDDAVVGYFKIYEFNSWTNIVMTNNVWVETTTNWNAVPAGWEKTLVFWDIGLTNGTTGFNIDWNKYYGASEVLGGTFGSNGQRVAWSSVKLWGENEEANSTYATHLYPTTNVIVLRTNKYEVGRAHIFVWNWESNDTATVSLSTCGLPNGQSYRVMDSQNYLGNPVLTGTYNPASPNATIPLTNTAVTLIVGTNTHYRRNPDVHTSRLFNAFVLLPTANTVANVSTLRVGTLRGP